MNTALSRTLVATYSLPMVGANFAWVLVMVYFPKYSIDTLLIAPATVGLVFGLARIWDAISDPFAGYLSDRTGACILMGALLLTRFRLTEDEHTRIRGELALRADEAHQNER